MCLLYTPHVRTEQTFSGWSNKLNNTQHPKKQHKCSVAKHLFKLAKCSENFAFNKGSVAH